MLFLVQFQGAFSDNFFKFLVIFFASRGVSTELRDERLFLILVVFTVPFIVFAMASGSLSDRFSKGRVITWTKLSEIGVMALGTLALYYQSFPFMLGVMFLMSVQSTVFSPAKYSSLPELLPEWRLSWGNGFIGLGTFVSIIAGGIAAGAFSTGNEIGNFWWAGVILIGIATMGTAVSFAIPRIPAASPGKKIPINFLAGLGRNLKLVRANRVLTLAIMGSVYFWLIAALIDPTMIVYGQDLLGLGDDQIGVLRAFLAIGIAVGSVLAGFLSGRKIEVGLIPIGTFGLAVSACAMALPGLSFGVVGFLLFTVGVSGGFFIVPVNALIQHLPDRGDKGSVMAVNGWLNSLGAFLAAVAFKFLKTNIGVDANIIVLVIGVATIGATALALWLIPQFVVRLFLKGLTRVIYRVKTIGHDHVPEHGGALLVANHLSMADALFVIASTDRPVRFIMHRDQYKRWWVWPFARMLKVVTINPEQFRPREILATLDTAKKLVAEGELVCIFAEGEISRTGATLPFRKGMAHIMKGRDEPIVPVHLDNVWGSVFSYQGGRRYWKKPRSLRYSVTVSYGAPMPADSAPEKVRSEVLALGPEAWEQRRRRIPTVGQAFVKTARKARRRMAFADSGGAKMSFMGALTKVLFLSGRLRKTWAGQETVGLLLPPSAGGALTNLAAMLMGKTVVNLNYTLSEAGIRSCVEQCGIKCVVSSKKVLEKFDFDLGVPIVTLEEIADAPRLTEKLGAAAMAWLCPRRLLLRRLAGSRAPVLDDIATIIFSSGSTGEPKGAMLSHGNVVSNMLQLNQAYDFNRNDRFLGVLPFFHSLGFTATLAGPAILGLGVAYHAVPTDARTVGKLVARHKLTLLLATPTFLQIYLRACKPEQFESLTLVVVGAEKMPPRIATAFEEKFGIAPLEAYGCTECSPGVSVNTPDITNQETDQKGGRPGTIGLPLPGMAVSIRDPDDGAPRAFAEPGLMWVKGPNIMSGYLGKPELTAEVLVDGWYNTGDIAALDGEGFITITDRLSRFSKIGGEMVPHIKIEELLHDLADLEEQSFAVTAVADERKGERLVVLHTLETERVDGLAKEIGAAEIPNLWKPKADQFFKIDELPYLGSGKLDLKAIKAIATERAEG